MNDKVPSPDVGVRAAQLNRQAAEVSVHPTAAAFSRASHDAIVAIGAVLVSILLMLAGVAVARYLSSHLAGDVWGNRAFLHYATTIALIISLIVAPIAVVLSWIAMVARARCESPKPKLPVFALGLSVAYASLLMCVVLFFHGLGQMH